MTISGFISDTSWRSPGSRSKSNSALPISFHRPLRIEGSRTLPVASMRISVLELFFPSRITGLISEPSSGWVCSSEPPPMVTSVGKISVTCISSLQTEPCSINPGQRRTQGTRIPPSKVVFFVPRQGRFTSSVSPPLSLVKKTNVFSEMPRSSTVSNMRPTASSRHLIAALRLSKTSRCRGISSSGP